MIRQCNLCLILTSSFIFQLIGEWGRATGYPTEFDANGFARGAPTATAADSPGAAGFQVAGDWGPAINIKELNTVRQDSAPSISPDGLTLYYARDNNDPEGKTDLVVSRRPDRSSPFGAPVSLGVGVNTSAFEGQPSVTADGLEIFFVRSQGEWLDNDLYHATRASTSEPFGTAQPLSELNTTSADAYPYITPDVLTLYYTYQGPDSAQSDIRMATRPNRQSPFGASKFVSELNTPEYEVSFSLSADGLEGYLSRRDDTGTFLYQVRRVSVLDPFGSPEKIASLDDPVFDAGAVVTAGGMELFFFSFERTGGAGGYDLWRSVRGAVPTPSPTMTPAPTPTATFTATPTQTPTPTPTPPAVRFDFFASDDGWTSHAAAPFTPPDMFATGEALLIRTTDNTNSFGYWESPAFDLGNPVSGAARISLAGSASGESLFAFRAVVKSPLEYSWRVPQFRLRATTENLEQSTYLVIDSRDDGALSPTADGREYILPFSVAEGASALRIAFDGLNFNPRDDPFGALMLDSAEVTWVSTPATEDFSPVGQYSFDTTSDDWTSVTTGVFTPPVFGSDGGALSITGISDSTNVFGYWNSPEIFSDPDPAKLYAITFEVESDVPESERSRVPQFRLRANDTGFHQAMVLSLESKGDATRSPVAGEPQEFTVYFVLQASSPPSGLTLAFDFLNFDAGDRSEATLLLNTVQIGAIDNPFLAAN